MTRTLLLGGTGTIGKRLVRLLAKEPGNLDLVAAARSSRAADELAAAGMASVEADLDRPETLAPAMKGVETLFMLKPYGIDYLIQSKIVVDAAKKAGVRHVVNLGSFGADDTVWTSIGWNRLVEAYLMQSGMKWTHLRPNFFMDNVPARTDFASGTIRHYFGDSRVSWIAADDIAAVAAVVLRDAGAHEGAIYPLASQAASMQEIAEIVSAKFGRPLRALYIPPEQAVDQLVGLGWGRDFARPFIAYMEAIAAGRVAEVADTVDTVEKLTGRPALHWNEWIERNSETFRPGEATQ
jgi:NAD(P)H dehydrogenase (quinone)